jgi:hypothetical protein
MALSTARSRSRNALRRLIAGVLLIGGSSSFGASPAPTRQLTVRVYDYSGVPAHIRTKAREGITAIFQRAGAELSWVDCPVSEGAEFRPAVCDSRPVPGLLTLKAVPESMAGGFRLPPDKFGLAIREHGAYIFFDRIRHHAASESLPLPSMLAIVTAHELGHLLLDAGHSPKGLMAEDLLRAQFRDAEKGVWPSFTQDQILQMQRPPQVTLVADAGSLTPVVN